MYVYYRFNPVSVLIADIHQDDIYILWFDIYKSMLEKYPELIRSRYKIAEDLDSPVSFLELIAKKRGTPPTKYGFDLNKASEILLNDYRSGAIGRISLESPASRLEMLERHQTLKKIAFKA
jgi:ribosome biogenesis GTPase A